MVRREVYYINLYQTSGSEQGGCRPCVILQNNVGNTYSGTTIIAPMTTKLKHTLPTHVQVSIADKNLDLNSVIMLEQIRVVDKRRLGDFVCRLSDETMEKVDKAIGISLALNKEERRKGEMNELQVFNNEELGLEVRTMLNEDGSISVNAEDTARGFGWTQIQSKNGKKYISVRWERMNEFSAECGFPHLWGKDDYLPEPLFYRLGMKANNAVAEKFQNWLAMEVIPSIRKTGAYQQKRMTPEEMMRVQLGMIDGHEERIKALEDTMTIDHGQQRVLERTVNKTVIDVLDGKQSNAYKEISKKVFAECNRDLKNRFNVNSRDDVPRKDYEQAIEYAKSWKPCTNTMLMIRDCNAQMTI